MALQRWSFVDNWNSFRSRNTIKAFASLVEMRPLSAHALRARLEHSLVFIGSNGDQFNEEDKVTEYILNYSGVDWDKKET